jgi:hypothetical protein
MPPVIHKPLDHGCIDAHGAVPHPDGTLLPATWLHARVNTKGNLLS